MNFEDFANNTVGQVRTVVEETKTAAIVIFLAGLLSGCVFF